MAAERNLICKVELDGDMRRLQLSTPLSLPRLLEDIRVKFALEADARYRLVCTDPDGDHITIATTEALVDAAGFANGVLRLQLVPSANRLFAQPQPQAKANPEAARKLRMLRRRQAILQRRLELAATQNAHIQQRLEALRQAEAKLLQEHPELSTMTDTETDDADRRAERARRFGCPAFGGMGMGMGMGMGRCPALSHVVCDGCEATIAATEIRFKCADCPNYDLCVACEANNTHDPSHGLLKLRPEAQAKHPNLPIHRPLLAAGMRGGCGRGSGMGGGMRWCLRQSIASPAAPSPMDQINKLFTQVVLPQLSGLLPPSLDLSAIFTQIMETVRSVQPELFQELANLAAEILAQGQLDLEQILPRLLAFAESKASLINEDLIAAVMMPVLGSIFRCSAPTPAAPQLNPADLFSGMLGSVNPADLINGLLGSFFQPAQAQPTQPEVPAAPQQPDFSPLAALSIPPEILEQLVNIAQNPSEALALWEAMNQ